MINWGENKMTDFEGRYFPNRHGYVALSSDLSMGMLTVRGDLSSKAFKNAFEFELPDTLTIRDVNGMRVAWMSPDELLFLCTREEIKVLMSKFRAALKNQHSCVADVSDARCVFTLHGSQVREVVAKLAPVAVAPGQFAPGQIRRTRFGQIAAAFWMQSEEEVKITCFRSFGSYMYKQLCVSIAQGSELDLWS